MRIFFKQMKINQCKYTSIFFLPLFMATAFFIKVLYFFPLYTGFLGR